MNGSVDLKRLSCRDAAQHKRRYLRQELLAGLVRLQLVNVLHEDALVFEHVTLGFQVEAVVPEECEIKSEITRILSLC